MGNSVVIKDKDTQNSIYTIRGVQVMLDEALAEMYGVETKRLNEQVRRNSERFLLTNAQVFQRLDSLELKQIHTD
jgi:hypothetical protein